MVVEEFVHVVFDESNESLERRESVNDDVGLDFSMGRLQIDDKVHQQEEEIDSKKEESPFHLLNLSKDNVVKNFQKNGNFSQIIHKIKL